VDSTEKAFALVIGAIILAMAFGIKHDMNVEAAFMAACRKDHKEYECTAMWRSGESHVVPMPIVIPVR
jgi:hypothetical protein